MHQHLQNLIMRFIRKQNVYQMKIKGQPPAIPPPPETKALYILGMMVAVSNPFIRPLFLVGWVALEWCISVGFPGFPSEKPPLWVRIRHHWQPLVLRSTFQQHLLASGFFATEKKSGGVFLGMQKSGWFWFVFWNPKELGCIKPWKIIANKCK